MASGKQPALEQEAGTQTGWNLIDDLRASVHGFEPHTRAEEQLYAEGLDQVANLGDARRTRLIASEEGVPAILWAVLIFGGIAAVGFTYLFGMQNTWAHRLMVVTLAAVIGVGFVHRRRPWAPLRGRRPHRDGGVRPDLGEVRDLTQPFGVELFLGLRLRLEAVYARPEVVDDGPPGGSPSRLRHQGRLSLLHQGPLLVDHLLGVGSAKFLDVENLGLGEPMGQPGDLGGGVGLLLDRRVGGLVLLPNGDDHERQEHGVDHAQGGVDEAGHVVVLLARGGWHEAMYQLEPYERGEANSTDHQDAVNYRL